MFIISIYFTIPLDNITCNLTILLIIQVGIQSVNNTSWNTSWNIKENKLWTLEVNAFIYIT